MRRGIGVGWNSCADGSRYCFGCWEGDDEEEELMVVSWLVGGGN